MGWKWLENAKQEFDSLMESGQTKPVSKNDGSFIIPNIHPLTQQACKTLLGSPVSPSDLKNLTNVAGLLMATVHGRSDFEFVIHNEIGVRYTLLEGGASYVHGQKRINLNRISAPGPCALCFVHEATHAREKYAGRAANSMDPQEKFVADILEEEGKTYFREAVVGRELLHLARRLKDPNWFSYTTNHPMQMWMHLVHGVRYATRPKEDILERDRSISGAVEQEIFKVIQPYFRRYVEAYRYPEIIKWEIIHGQRPPMDAETRAGVLTAAFEKQAERDRERSYPQGPVIKF